jgi:hypothetical protein
VAEKPVVPMKPGNAGRGKGPQFKTDARDALNKSGIAGGIATGA